MIGIVTAGIVQIVVGVVIGIVAVVGINFPIRLRSIQMLNNNFTVRQKRTPWIDSVIPNAAAGKKTTYIYRVVKVKAVHFRETATSKPQQLLYGINNKQKRKEIVSKHA